MFQKMIVAGVIAVSPAVGFSETLDCKFDLACFDTDGCANADNNIRIKYQPKPLGPNGMISKATIAQEEIQLTGLYARKNETITFVAGDAFEGHSVSLTVNDAGEARYTKTTTKPMKVELFAGKCEVSK